MTAAASSPDAVAAPTPAAADVQRLAATHYENFPVGSWLVPRRLRPHVHRLYAFARVADDLADEQRDAEALAALRRSLADSLAGDPTGAPPLVVDLVATVRGCDLPPQLLFDLLDAFALDLRRSRHDEASLYAYCRQSADPVGRLMLRIFGYRDDALDRLSDRVCTGLQLLNHLQDIGEDLRLRDRIYFPGADLARFAVTEDDLRAPAASAGVRAFAAHWHARVSGLLREGWPLTRAVRGRLRLELRAILHGAALCLRRIRRADFDLLRDHDALRLSTWDKLSLPLRALGGGTPRELR